MSKRTREPGPVAVTKDQAVLFDVPAPAAAAAVKPRRTRPCEVCGRTLRSARAVEVGAGQTCAAKVGAAVLVNTRAARRSSAA